MKSDELLEMGCQQTMCIIGREQCKTSIDEANEYELARIALINSCYCNMRGPKAENRLFRILGDTTTTSGGLTVTKKDLYYCDKLRTIYLGGCQRYNKSDCHSKLSNLDIDTLQSMIVNDDFDCPVKRSMAQDKLCRDMDYEPRS